MMNKMEAALAQTIDQLASPAQAKRASASSEMSSLGTES